MNGEVIKTLAQYYANLNKRKTSLENPELIDLYATDTNGVTKDDPEQEATKDIRSEANK